MKLKFLLFGGIALAMAACADDTMNPGNDNNIPEQEENTPLSTATYTVRGGDQSRAFHTGYYGSLSTRAMPAEMPNGITIPEGAVDITANNFDRNAKIYVVPAGKTYSGTIPDNFNGSVYVEGTLNGIGNNLAKLDLYILPTGEVLVSNEPNANNINIFNEGTIHFTHNITYSRIQNLYNSGLLIVDGGISNNSIKIYSEGQIELNGGNNPMDFQPQIITDHIIKVNGSLKIQTQSSMKDVCGYEATGTLEVVADNTVGYLKADVIKMDGHKIILKPESHVIANTIILTNSGTGFFLESESVALVECDDLNWQNDKLASKFGAGVYLNVKTINGKTPTENDQISTQNGINNSESIHGQPACGEPWGKQDEEPEPEPSLDIVTIIESPTHDHDEDKTDEHRRHLSATSLTFDGHGNIYASYHMRGGNWAQDTYDKDDIEGCLERWSFNDNNEIEIGNWMWTNDFDFNHIILDDPYIITVGHKGGEVEIEGDDNKRYTDFGGIIGRLPISIWEIKNENWDAEDELSRDDFEYKYLTTEKPLYAANGTTRIDYQSAGDGNCVVRVGDEYYVATSAGYGKIRASDFKRIKDDEGNVEFTSTPGSSKYLVVNNNEVNVLYLNERANPSEKETSFGATLATINSSSFPTGTPTKKGMEANVSPVDGKNVIAVDNGVVYACLSKGGLQIGDEVVTFGEQRSVNGVAVYGNYIYVANGSYISVLDKATHQLVVERKGDTENVSANFVEVKEYNGDILVFVAFGQEGIKVFKFNEGK